MISSLVLTANGTEYLWKFSSQNPAQFTFMVKQNHVYLVEQTTEIKGIWKWCVLRSHT